MTWMVGEEDEIEVTPDFVASVMEHAVSRAHAMLDESNERDAFGESRVLLTAVAIESVHQLAQDGLLADGSAEHDLVARLRGILADHGASHDASDEEEAGCNLQIVAALERLLLEYPDPDENEPASER